MPATKEKVWSFPMFADPIFSTDNEIPKRDPPLFSGATVFLIDATPAF